MSQTTLSRSLFRKVLYRNIAMPLLLALASGAIFVGLIFYLMAASSWIDRSENILSQTQKVYGLISDAETGIRGYIISGRKEFLAPYSRSTGQIELELEYLKDLVSDSSLQRERADFVASEFARWREYAHATVTSQKSLRDSGRLALETRGKAQMELIRSSLSDMIKHEQKSRVEKSDYTRNLARVLVILVVGVSLALGIGIAGVGQRQLLTLSDAYENLLRSQESAHSALKRSEERLSMVLDAARIGTWDWDIRSGTVIWNTHHEMLFGYEPGTPVRAIQDFEDRLDPDELQDVYKKIDHALSRRSFHDSEYRIHLPDGRVRWAHARGHGLYDSDGNPYRMMGVAIDITDRKESEFGLRTIREAGAKFSRSLDSTKTITSVVSVVVPSLADWCLIDLVDEEGVVDRVVVHHRDKARQPIADLLKHYHPRLDRIGPISTAIRSGQREVLQEMPEVRDQMDPFSQIGNEQRQIASQLGIKAAVVIPLVARDKIIGALTLVRDSKKFQDRDLDVAQEVANRAAVAIDNARLYAESQRASEAKSRFLANMSHEIRTPIGVILGFADLALSGKCSETEYRNYFETIQRNGRSLLRLLGDVLDLSKVEAEKLELERINFNLPELLEDVVSSLKIQADQKNVSLSLKVRGEIPRLVKSDPTRIRQILNNVVGNAVKFTEKGRVDIELEAQRGHASEPDRLCIQVKDTGIGLTDDQQKQLFRPFSQADNSTTRKFGGTGLGLMLSRRLAQALAGDLQLLHSAPGKGSTFLITLGVTFTDQESLGVPRENSKSRPATLHGVRVLVVDDSIDNQIIVGKYLSDAGAQVESAMNGEEGVSKALEFQPDVVLMDIQMPVLDGFAAAKKLRLKNFSGPILALTANSLLSEKERALKGGFDDFLVKPLERGQLIEKIRRCTRSIAGDRGSEPTNKRSGSSPA